MQESIAMVRNIKDIFNESMMHRKNAGISCHAGKEYNRRVTVFNL
jgi:hypothetical protein